MAHTPSQYGLKLWQNGATLRVRFVDGTAAQHEKVKLVSNEWTRHANLHFQFGSSGGGGEIRISFKEADGTWSYIGTDALAIPASQATMNLIAEDFFILHEFGHALGLIHEHNSPNAKIKWNKANIYRDLGGPPNLWPKEQVDSTMFETYKNIRYRDFDPDSIMMYSYPASWFADGKIPGSRAKIRAPGGGPQSLSKSDKEFIRKLYPPVKQVGTAVRRAKKAGASGGKKIQS